MCRRRERGGGWRRGVIVVIAREDQILGRTWQILANLGNSWHFLAFLGGFRENLFGHTTAPLSNHEWFLVQNRFSHLFARKDANSGFFQARALLYFPQLPTYHIWYFLTGPKKLMQIPYFSQFVCPSPLSRSRWEQVGGRGLRQTDEAQTKF